MKISKKKESISENQNEVEAAGEVGTVYKTKIGMDEADPYEHGYGWRQKTATTREGVSSEDAGTHQRWMVWRRVQKETK